ncbi:putative N-acetylated-alpha-linked acidic dipeptidase [Montipora capricornis]|uniref:putative N-acetylated-alpha-linked acidic dipeptidase n=1 Tax=Montipora capricornis TaxID=246305 RepID=UPI0035F1E79C
MELTSSKLRLASSVSSIQFTSSRFSKRLIAVVVLCVMLAVGGGFLLGYFVKGNNSDDICGHCNSNANRSQTNDRQPNFDDVKKIFSQFEKEVSVEELRNNLRYFSEQIHLAGKQRSQRLADYLASKWEEYGFDEVEMPKYKVLLSYPMEDKPNMISILNGNGTTVKNITQQLEVTSGPGTNNRTLFTPYTAYSMNGTATGKLIYINEGNKVDFEELDNSSISINGSIVLSRSFENFYPAAIMAVKRGAKGLLYYPDPNKFAREGMGENSTYPNRPWLASDAVILAGIYGRFGDPETRLMPSVDGIRRITFNDAKDSLPILIQPISYGTARMLFQRIDGDAVPFKWRRDLPSTFRCDQNYTKNNWTIKLSINNQLARKTIYNVIATITGREEPDRYVFFGNHRDAWVYGAADASTGTSLLLETSRVLMKLVKQGWRPRRTIKFCSFGAEEFGLMGSVEWLEENSYIFKERGVAYLNTDVPVQGSHTLLAQTSPLLMDLIYKWIRQVKVPVDEGRNESMFDVMMSRGPASSIPGYPQLRNFRYLSDFIPFYFTNGIPSADFSYFYNYTKEGDFELYPTYHTQEDTFYWIEKFADPKFEIHRSMTLLMGGMLIDLADSLIIPLNVTRLKDALRKAYFALTASSSPLIKATLVQQHISALNRSLVKFSSQCDSFNSEILQAKVSDKVDPLKVRTLNNQLNMLGKAFINPRTKSDNPAIVQHVAFSERFNGVLNALGKTNDTSEIQEQLSIVNVAISSAAKILKLIEIVSQE